MKLADRCTVKKATGFTPAYLVQGREYVLPIEADIPTVQNLGFQRDMTTEDLLFVRMRQIDLKDQNVQEALSRIARRRLEAKELWDEQHERVNRPAGEQLDVGDLVLVKNTQLDKGFGRKLEFRWLGPYEIVEAYPNRNYYQLAELDGARLRKTTHGDRLKKYFEPDVPEPTLDAQDLNLNVDPADINEDMHAEMYGGSEVATSDDEEAPATPPTRKSARVIDRNERERQRRLAEGIEEELGPRYDPDGPDRPVDVVIPDQPPIPLSQYEAMATTYQHCDGGILSRWEKTHFILRAENYYQYPPEIRRESRKRARSRRVAIATSMKKAEAEGIWSRSQDPHYWDDVLSEMRRGWRTGGLDDEGREVWSFDY